MCTERDFETATEGCAMNRGDDGLRRVLHFGLNVGERCADRSLATKLRDIRARNERAAFAD